MAANKNFKYPDTKMYNYVVNEFKSKGVTIKDIAKLVILIEKDYIPNLTIDIAEEHVKDVLHKREVLNNIAVGLYLDKMANKHLIDEPLQDIIENDAGVFGVDEVLSVAAANVYGSIGVSNFGYLDKTKEGIMSRLDNSKGITNTFIDDAVGAIAAAVAGKLAHKYA